MKKISICMLVTVLVLTGCGGSAKPKPGATFSGAIAIDADKAESATLAFTISDDSASISNVGVSFTNFKCEGMSAGQMTLSSGENFPITDGIDISPSNIGQITGRFTSSTKAAGTIHVQLEINTGFGTVSCDMGTWNWSAEAK